MLHSDFNDRTLHINFIDFELEKEARIKSQIKITLAVGLGRVNFFTNKTLAPLYIFYLTL